MKTYLCLLAIVFASPAQAAILTLSPGGYSVTAISGLVVNGSIYDVTITRYNSFDSLYGTGDPPARLPFFYFDAAGAIAASHAIAEALNAGPIVPVEAGPGSSVSPAIVIPYRYELDPENSFRNAGVSHDLDFPSTPPPPWRASHKYVGLIPDRDLIALNFAEFTLIATPEPTSLTAWLGLLAAGASIAYRRRRQQ